MSKIMLRVYTYDYFAAFIINTMFLTSLDIRPDSVVRDIVGKDHRTATVFRKYGIEYCCGGKWTLEAICMMKGVSYDSLQQELKRSVRSINVHPATQFNSWRPDFLTEYLVNIHHQYLRDLFANFTPALESFIEEHEKKYPRLIHAREAYNEIKRQLTASLPAEEEVLFPYITQLTHVYENKDPYAHLLVKTLRKPVELILKSGGITIHDSMNKLREATENYTLPVKPCTSHAVVFANLRELDNDLAQHHFLEYDILYPRMHEMEKAILG